MTLYVTLVSYYGKRTILPECEVSRLFCDLLKQKTLTEGDVEIIKRLGFRVEVKGQEL